MWPSHIAQGQHLWQAVPLAVYALSPKDCSSAASGSGAQADFAQPWQRLRGIQAIWGQVRLHNGGRCAGLQRKRNMPLRQCSLFAAVDTGLGRRLAFFCACLGRSFSRCRLRRESFHAVEGRVCGGLTKSHQEPLVKAGVCEILCIPGRLCRWLWPCSFLQRGPLQRGGDLPHSRRGTQRSDRELQCRRRLHL